MGARDFRQRRRLPAEHWRLADQFGSARARERRGSVNSPSGVTDWGVWDIGDPRGGRRSAIDIVIEFGRKRDAAEAALWLCERCGVDPVSLGWQANGAGSQQGRQQGPQQGPPGAGQASQQSPQLFELFWHGKEYNRELRSWLVKDLILETGQGLASGQWGTAKTFTVLDLAASVMTITPFAGREVVRQGGVLFVAAEGAYEIPIRLKGVVEEKLRPAALASGTVDLENLPFAWIEDCLNLQDNGDFNKLVETAKQAAQNIRDQFDLPLALIVIDTLSAAGNFKDANDAAEGQRIMNRLGGAKPSDRRLRSRRRSLRQGGGNRHEGQFGQGGRRRRRAGAAGRPGNQRHHQQHPHGTAKAPRRQGRHGNAVRSESGQSRF